MSDETIDAVLEGMQDALFWLFWPNTWKQWILYIVIALTIGLLQHKYEQNAKERSGIEQNGSQAVKEVDYRIT